MAPHTVNPNEHLAIPKWINADYFQTIVERDVPDSVKIVNLTPIAATQPGENYTSIMVRVNVDLEMKDGSIVQKSYIMKTTLEGDNSGSALVKSMCLFPKEKQMYQNLLPSFEKLYQEAGVDIRFGAKCLHIEETPERIALVMEDLGQRNLTNVDRLKGFDLAHITAVLRKLAELHAASAMYHEVNGDYDPIFDVVFFQESNRAMFQAMASSRQQLYFKAMREWGLNDAEYYIKKIPLTDATFDEAIRLYAVDPTEFNVLNHGDCWSNNIMFNYKQNGDINETILVDFQIGKWGTPANDLWYVITTSASLDIKVKHYDHFIQIYHERLAECLQLLKYPKHIPTLKELHITMLRKGKFSFLIASGVLCAVLMPSDKDANIDNMLSSGPKGDEFKYKTLINPYYARAMCQLLPFLDQKGILDN